MIKREDNCETIMRSDQSSTTFGICEAWWRVRGQPPYSGSDAERSGQRQTTTEMNLSGTDACWRLASQNLTRAGPSDGPSSRNSHPSSWMMGWIRLISGSRRIKDRCGKPPIAHTVQNLLPQCASLLETFSVSVDTPLTLSVQNT